MKWIGQQIYDQISRFRNDVFIDNSDLTIYKPINDDPVVVSIGSSATERLEIKANYASGTQEVNNATFKTYTGSATSNRGRFIFSADETTILQIWDAGLNLSASKALQINGTDIITDSSGTATLSNIDALDATTIATFETAMEANLDSFSSGIAFSSGITVDGGADFRGTLINRPSVEILNSGNNAAGGIFQFKLDKGAAGADNDIPGIIQWQSDNDAQEQYKLAEIYGTVADATDGQEAGAMYLKVAAYDNTLETGLKLDGDTDADGEVDVTIGSGAASVTTIAGTLTMGTTATIDNEGAWVGAVIPSAKLDGDTAHLSGAQTFGGVKTFGTTTKLQFRDANAYINSPDSNDLEIAATDITLDAAGTIKLEGPVRPTGQIWMKNVNFVDDLSTDEIFMPLAGTAENASETNVAVGMIMPVAGKLLKAHLKTQRDHSASSNQTTIKMVNFDADEAITSSNDSILCSVTQAGTNASTVNVFDFTGTLDSGVGAVTNSFTAGESIALSIKNSVAVSGGTCKYFLTFVFELDWSGY